MPNWCKGILKIRGTKENILNFLRDGLKPCDYVFGQNKKPHTVEYDGDCDITLKCENTWAYYIDGTHRNFIENVNKDLYLYDFSDDVYVCALEDFCAAWGIDAKPFAEISKKYSVDFKIYAFECGMEFNQDIEIVAGEIVKDEEVKFGNYAWECINPFIGG